MEIEGNEKRLMNIKETAVRLSFSTRSLTRTKQFQLWKQTATEDDIQRATRVIERFVEDWCTNIENSIIPHTDLFFDAQCDDNREQSDDKHGDFHEIKYMDAKICPWIETHMKTTPRKFCINDNEQEEISLELAVDMGKLFSSWGFLVMVFEYETQADDILFRITPIQDYITIHPFTKYTSCICVEMSEIGLTYLEEDVSEDDGEFETDEEDEEQQYSDEEMENADNFPDDHADDMDEEDCDMDDDEENGGRQQPGFQPTYFGSISLPPPPFANQFFQPPTTEPGPGSLKYMV